MFFLSKLIFLIIRPQVIIVINNDSVLVAQNIYKMLKTRFGARVLEFGAKKLDNKDEVQFFLRNSSRAILIINNLGVFSAQDISKIVDSLPETGRLALNYDQESIRGLRLKSRAGVTTFGLAAVYENFIGPDIQASDIRFTENGLNFKLNYRGSSVPIRASGLNDKEEIYGLLALLAAGIIFEINLVELSQAVNV